MPKNIVVIGAGYGGLSAATHLAHKGHTVTVLEKNTLENTRIGLIEKNGFRFDPGPSWYMLPELFEQYFEQLGEKRENYYSIQKLDPSFRVIDIENNKTYDVPSEYSKLVDFFESVEKGAGQKLVAYLDKAKFKYDFGISRYIHQPFLKNEELLKGDLLRNFIKFELLTSYESSVKKQFSHPVLQGIFTHSTVFLGGSPKNTPALYNLVSWSELVDGIYYPEGGFWNVTKTLEKIALEKGVTIHYSENVSSLEFHENSIKTVHTESNSYPADVVVSNADYHFVETQLLPTKLRTYSDSYWSKRTVSPAVFLLYLGLSHKIPQFEHHTFIFNTAYKHQTDESFNSEQWPDNPQFYISATSKTDPHTAPVGKEAIVALIPISAGLNDNQKIRDTYSEYIIQKLSQIVGYDIQPFIVFNETRSINDFTQRYHAYKGNAFGLAHTLLQSFTLRPKLKSKSIQNLYYTGHYTVPGISAPLTLLSGMITADLIDQIK